MQFCQPKRQADRVEATPHLWFLRFLLRDRFLLLPLLTVDAVPVEVLLSSEFSALRDKWSNTVDDLLDPRCYDKCVVCAIMAPEVGCASQSSESLTSQSLIVLQI